VIGRIGRKDKEMSKAWLFDSSRVRLLKQNDVLVERVLDEEGMFNGYGGVWPRLNLTEEEVGHISATVSFALGLVHDVIMSREYPTSIFLQEGPLDEEEQLEALNLAASELSNKVLDLINPGF
jgi:hypothetical protein